MKTAHKLILFFFVLSAELFGQTVCDQYIAGLKSTSQQPPPKRSFRMTTQIIGDKNINYTEYDTLGRIHFWGNVGSLKMESFYANGKRYSKIQSDYIKDDEWTFQEVNANDSGPNKFVESFRNDMQSINCQLVGEEILKKKKCKILSYIVLKNVLKRNNVDSFLMETKVKTWFCPDDSLVYKYEYETTTERLSQTIKSILEYDVAVKIEIPKNAKFEQQRKVLLTQNATDSVQKEIKPAQTESKQTQDSIVVYSIVEQTPEYKEGMAALLKYISNNMHYPEDARKAGIDGTVSVGFVVELDGKLSNIHIKRGLREDIDAEAKRIVESMSGTWKAGKVNGQEVRSTYVLPLKFELHE